MCEPTMSRADDRTCDVPAHRGDLDHVIRYPVGATSEANLQAACRRDHRLKHEGRWHHQLSDDPAHQPGTIVITSPTGHIYLSQPPAIGLTANDLRTPNPARPMRQDGRIDGGAQDQADAQSIDETPTATDLGPPPF